MEKVYKRCTCGAVRRVDESINHCSDIRYSGCPSVAQSNGRFTIDEGCHSVLFCGPGHQTTIRCEVTFGPHTIHEGDVMGETIQWEGEQAMTGFFDEAPIIDG